MADYTKYEDLFMEAWCPLLGEIPGFGLPKYDPLGELAGIIDNARSLLEIGMDLSSDFESNFPSSDEIDAFIQSDSMDIIDLEMVKNTREIFRMSACLQQYATIDTDGFSIEGTMTHVFVEEILTIGKSVCHIEASGYMIFATLAIKSSYSEAYNLVMNDEKPNPSNAWGLLRAAEKIKAGGEIEQAQNKIKQAGNEIEQANNEIDILTPLANKELAAQKYRSKGGEAGAIPEETLQLWQKKADRLKERGLSKRAIAEIIAKSQSDWKPETIRRKI